MALRIEDYALIGDRRSAALVGVDGSIDWLAFPRFDSAACFAALLGSPDNGRWIIAPTDDSVEVRRRYRPGTLILETEFETKSGKATLIDFMPPVFGEVADVMLQSLKHGLKLRERSRTLRPVILDYLAKVWREPDEVIWEVRGKPSISDCWRRSSIRALAECSATFLRPIATSG
jgi:Domain of unknown function (DUF5911)